MDRNKLKKWGGTIFRLFLSIALIYWLFSIVNLQKTLHILTDANFVYLFLSIIIFSAALLIFSFRWKILLSALGFAQLNLSKLFRYYWVGLFFNNFLPTSVGGDIVRAYYLSHDINAKGESFASVVLERILGFIITALIGLFAILFLFDQFSLKQFTGLSIFLIIFLMFMLAIIFYDPFFSVLTGWLERIKLFNVGPKFKEIFNAFRQFKKFPDKLVKAFTITILGQFLIIIFNYFIFIALTGKTDILPFLIVVPLTIVASLFPSINGLGTRETAYVFLLQLFGIEKEISLALALLVFILPLIISLGGGIIYTLNPVKLRAVAWKSQEDF